MKVVGVDQFPDDNDESKICGGDLILDVYKSGAGFYVGTYCVKCGPFDRHSGYFKTKEDAVRVLPDYEENL